MAMHTLVAVLKKKVVFAVVSVDHAYASPALNADRRALPAAHALHTALTRVSRISAEAAAEGTTFKSIVALPERAADRNADEALFASLGLLTASSELTKRERAALTHAVALRCAWLLRNGSLLTRVNAASVLRRHAAARGNTLPACLLAPDVLTALVAAASPQGLLHTIARPSEQARARAQMLLLFAALTLRFARAVRRRRTGCDLPAAAARGALRRRCHRRRRHRDFRSARGNAIHGCALVAALLRRHGPLRVGGAGGVLHAGASTRACEAPSHRSDDSLF
jgi:hypothetical protein